MKKILLICLLILFGCSTQIIYEDSELNLPVNLRGEEKYEFDETQIKEVPTKFESDMYIPDGSEDVESFSLDFENDGLEEYIIKYKLDDVVVREGDLRQITYLKVYKWLGEAWEIVKEDQVTIEGGVENASFRNIEKVDLGLNDYLLVIKNNYRAPLTYYIYGKYEDGLADLPIEKGYLNEEEYLKDGDIYMRLVDLEINDGKLVESYVVECEKYEDLPLAADRSCYSFDLVHKYDDGFNGEPKVENLVEREEF